MMNKEKRIIEYLDGVMLPEEKAGFENELRQDNSLRNEVSVIKERFEKLGGIKERDPIPGYFSNLIPSFREKLELNNRKVSFGKRFLDPVYDFMLSFRGVAFGTVVSLFLVYMLFFRTGNDAFNIDNVNEIEIAYDSDPSAGYETIQEEDVLLSVYNEFIESLGIQTEDVNTIYTPDELFAYNIEGISDEDLDRVIEELKK
ncbi:MAG: hypothetical protein AB9882_04705 [Ignavibacteriaceae bacterium]